jgi:hypothetical protein
MCAQPSESLSEFEPENSPAPVSQPQVLEDGGSLLDVVAAASPADTPQAPLSRIESRRARRRASHLKRLARKAGAFLEQARSKAWSGAQAGARATHHYAREAVAGVNRLTHRMTAQTIDAARATGRVSDRAWSSTRRRLSVPTTSRTVLEDLEFNGAIVAMSLALLALGYGGFQRGPRPAPVAPLAALAVESVPLPPPAPAAVVAVPPAVVAVPSAVTADAHVVALPAKPALNATTLNAIWKRQDSRSLQQAFTGLRSQTLAFHRCGMRMTDTDRAVATCEGASRAKWTINFRRSAGRWQIDRVTTR